MGLFANSTSGFGTERVSGRSLVPNPPTSINAFICTRGIDRIFRKIHGLHLPRDQRIPTNLHPNTIIHVFLSKNDTCARCKWTVRRCDEDRMLFPVLRNCKNQYRLLFMLFSGPPTILGIRFIYGR